jgi:hypothetical protein
MTEQELLERWPITVSAPGLLGRYKMAIIYDPHHLKRVLLARSTEGLERLFTRVLEEDFNAILSSKILDIEVVSPPFWYRVKFAEFGLETDVTCFGTCLGEDLQKCDQLPPGVSVCQSYLNRYVEDTEERIDPGHRSCKNCYSKFCFDAQDLYLKHEKPSKIYGVPSVAPKAAEDEEIWLMQDNASMEEISDAYVDAGSKMFFFRKLGEEDASNNFEKMCAAARYSQEMFKAQRDREWEERKLTYREEAIDRVNKIFGGPNGR